MSKPAISRFPVPEISDLPDDIRGQIDVVACKSQIDCAVSVVIHRVR